MDWDLVHHIMGYTCNSWNINGIFIYNNGIIMVCQWIYLEFTTAVDNKWKPQFDTFSCFFRPRRTFLSQFQGFSSMTSIKQRSCWGRHSQICVWHIKLLPRLGDVDCIETCLSYNWGCPLAIKPGNKFQHVWNFVQCGAPKIAKLVYNYNRQALWFL